MFKFLSLNKKNNPDLLIFLPIIFLIIIGIFGIFSISMRIDGKYDFLIKKHLIFCFVGVIMIFYFSKISIKNLIFSSIILFTISFILSIATIFFFPETKGASRWIKLFNFSLQPTEILKPSFVILSSLLLGRYNNKKDFSFLLNIILFRLISLILLSQPDFGMFILFFCVWILQVLNSNLEKKIIFPILGLFFLTFVLSYLFIDHVRFRIDNFLFPTIGDNYQITKSLESFANGGLFGQGIGNGTVSKNLPDAHSDFIYALIGEEFGFITAFSILIFYIIIYIRIYFVSKITKNLFILNSLTGLGNILIFQTIINISSSLNLLPTKGMTLPFISYGGSSIISSSLVVGFILTLIKNAKNQ